MEKWEALARDAGVRARTAAKMIKNTAIAQYEMELGRKLTKAERDEFADAFWGEV